MRAAMVALLILLPVKGMASDRPPECPHRYCGCFLSKKIFGRVIPKLNLAQNWMNFPIASPGYGRVAARKGHVMMLLSHVEGKNWYVLDPNSGGGLTREHIRSIAGFKIVNPTMMAGL